MRSTTAWCPSSQASAWLWGRRRLITAMSLATESTIKCEARARGLHRRPPGPVVTWHDGGSGTPLVLINGFTGSGEFWPTAWVRRLEEHYRVIRIDNRGTGGSRNAPAPFTMADLADDVRDVLDALGAEQAVVLGHSMGGMIAQEMAIRHPERVQRLVLVATMPPIPKAIASPYGVELASSLLWTWRRDDVDPDQSLVDATTRHLSRFTADGFEPTPELAEDLGRRALSSVTGRRAMLMQARAIYAWRGPRRLATITAPTLVVQGNADRVVNDQNARNLARYIPGARLVELPGIGHLTPWEAGDELVALLTEGAS